jgi:hypothetical protein
MRLLLVTLGAGLLLAGPSPARAQWLAPAALQSSRADPVASAPVPSLAILGAAVGYVVYRVRRSRPAT